MHHQSSDGCEGWVGAAGLGHRSFFVKEEDDFKHV